MFMQRVANLVVLALCLVGLAAAKETGVECAAATCSSNSTTQGSVMLQRSQKRASAHIFESEENSDFCCFYGDSCNACQSASKPGDWCATSKANCESCSPGASMWCSSHGQGAAPGPAPAPPAPTPGHGGHGGGSAGNGHSGNSGNSGNNGKWDGTSMKMTHYWDCSGQGCDAATLQPWNMDKYITPPGYGPQDPADFGGAKYGEKMWLTGAASDALSALMGPDDGCCGGDPNDGGVGGCGKCLLIQNPDSTNPDWTAVVMKKNRCPPWSNGCDKVHMDVAVPGFDNLQYSTANVCGDGSRGDTYIQKHHSAICGGGTPQHCNCWQLPGDTPAQRQIRAGCLLFKEWGWHTGTPHLDYRPVPCPQNFINWVKIGKAFNNLGVIELTEDFDNLTVAASSKQSPAAKQSPLQPPAPRLPLDKLGGLVAAGLVVGGLSLGVRMRRKRRVGTLLPVDADEEGKSALQE
uniref:Cellulase n=1 Tax=Alexandrium catenella TaxID=2925 RepID=A0A7S1RTP6_ALECA